MAQTWDSRTTEPIELRERDGRLEFVIEGEWVRFSLRTIHGRMAARMYAYSIEATDKGLSDAILARVGREG